MQIRQKLTYQFVSIVGIILVLFSVYVYFFSADYRRENLYDRLKSRAINIANLLIDIDEVDTVLLKKIERDNPLSLPEEKIIVFNFQNEILFSTDNSNIFDLSPTLLDKIRLEEEVRFRQGAYELLGILYTSKYDRFVVVDGAIDIYGMKKLSNLQALLLIGFGICIFIIFIAGSIYSKRALLPISNIISQVNSISGSSMNIRLDEGNKKDEIAKLSETFNNMLNRLVSAFTLQKSFIANASHELRTPLTAISGQLEVLLLQDRDPEFYKENIVSVLDDVKNLNLIANRLLLLMQASAESSRTAFNLIRVDELLWQIKSDMARSSTLHQVVITFDPDMDEDSLTISGNEQLFRSALFNLIDNGCKYSPNHKTEIVLKSDGGLLTINFRDTGIGIEPDDLMRIFEPFHRGKNAETVKGHGIGLSLVQKIIELHKGTIQILSEVNIGTTVTITVPSNKF